MSAALGHVLDGQEAGSISGHAQAYRTPLHTEARRDVPGRVGEVAAIGETQPRDAIEKPQKKPALDGSTGPGDGQPELQHQQSSEGELRRKMRNPKLLAIKNHLIAMTGEYVGTTLFLLIALGATQVANIPTTSVSGATNGVTQSPNTSSLLFVALAFGFSLAVNAWVFFRVSGGLFNPAISFAMLLVGALPPIRAGLLIIAQLLGGITGAAIIHALLPGTLYVRTQLGGGISVVQGLFVEMFLTAVLMITIFLLAVDKSKATYIAPIGIGLALFICEMVGVYYTGGSLNPARSFGPDVVLHEFDGYHWIYWVGPGLGSILAAGFYKMLKVLHFETANPGQDAEKGVQEEIKKRAGAQADDETAVPGPIPSPISASSRKAIATAGPSMQGPGLGDLDTESQPALGTNNVWTLDPASSPSNRIISAQLERLEALLMRALPTKPEREGYDMV